MKFNSVIVSSFLAAMALAQSTATLDLTVEATFTRLTKPGVTLSDDETSATVTGTASDAASTGASTASSSATLSGSVPSSSVTGGASSTDSAFASSGATDSAPVSSGSTGLTLSGVVTSSSAAPSSALYSNSSAPVGSSTLLTAINSGDSSEAVAATPSTDEISGSATTGIESSSIESLSTSALESGSISSSVAPSSAVSSSAASSSTASSSAASSSTASSSAASSSASSASTTSTLSSTSASSTSSTSSASSTSPTSTSSASTSSTSTSSTSTTLSSTSADSQATNTSVVISDEDRVNVLNSHNDYRALHQDTDPLVWNDDLADYAYEYTQSLIGGSSDPCNYVLVHSGGSYGENLAAGTNSDPVDLVGLWYDEIEYYDYNNVTGVSHNGHDVGHFTQLVWASSTEVGCSVTKCSSGAVYLICEYSPAGNIKVIGGDDDYILYKENVKPLIT
ncbi:unnamed protein product [Kluyveromyces dobzhanskii CBS 2104]|uniref:WGS project CCBQ000000000 data, contig MAT n=1 Tax=Kluyveromyces dobzhanskii CBS 2104 TaxID=1427455 RepID=A0A0A8L3B8_9SACH|nr:unnamed protein product [Kluyveromyces dobzhanskii CBS 2104]